MPKFKRFITNSLGYIIIISISLVSLYYYLENMPAIQQKKKEVVVEVEKSLSSSLPQLALAHNKIEPSEPSPQVAGANTEKKELVYIVQKGDMLWRIAEKYYGDGFKAFDIAKNNNLSGIDKIEVGQNIKLPNVYDNFKP